VVIEFSLNDNSTALYNSFERRSYELLLRQLLSLPGRPTVLLLHHYPWWRSGGGGLESGLYWKEPEGMLTMFSFYYDIPSLSLRTAAWHLMDGGVDGFKVGGRGRIPGRGWAGAGARVVWARLTRRHCQPVLVGRSPCRCHGWTLLPTDCSCCMSWCSLCLAAPCLQVDKLLKEGQSWGSVQQIPAAEPDSRGLYFYNDT
jgi:hypothetical protein